MLKTEDAPLISWFRINIYLIFFFSVLFRIIALDHIPGVNGDEAFFGINSLALLRGGHFMDHTPSGNIINPFYMGLLFILQAFLPISFWVLRLPALLTGLALIPVTFYVIKKLFDAEKALFATLLTSAIPINIAYSRFGWEPSQTTFVSIIVIYFVLKEKWLFVFFAFVAAYLIHPTNLFLIPLVLVYPIISLLKQSYRIHPLRVVSLSALGGIIFFTVMALVYWQVPFVFHNMSSHIWIRVQDFHLWLLFLLDYARLFSGTTIYEYICGSGYASPTFWFDISLLAFFVVLFVYGFNKFSIEKKQKEFGLLTGLLTALVLFYLIAGNQSIRPHLERYSMFLVMPTILVVTLILGEFATSRMRKFFVHFVVIVLCWLLLMSFLTKYFVYMMRTGGTSHYTFITGPVEPKQLSVSIIVEDSQGAAADVFTSQWWNYCPIAYLASAYKNLTVYQAGRFLKFKLPSKNKTYVVVFSGDKLDLEFREKYLKATTKCWAIRDFSGRIVQYVYRLQ